MTKSFTKRLHRAIAVLMAVAMLVGTLPADMLGGIASVKAAATSVVYNFGDLAETIEGTTGTFQDIAVDATNGKLGVHSGGGCCAQFNAGTKLSVPVAGPCDITVNSHHGASYALYTINGEAASTTETSTTVAYTGGAGTVDIVATGGAYITSITLTYAETGAPDDGGDVTGGDVTGGDVTGGDVTGGDVTGGDVTGGDVTGGDVTGGDVTGGDVTGGDVTSGDPETEDPGIIDVWDFGAEQLDTERYNNMLNADIINSWYPGVTAGTLGKNIASFATDEIAFNDGGYPATHRLRSTNTALTRYDDKSLKSDKDGTIEYRGYIYSNKSASADVYVSIKANKGDIIKAYVASNGTNSEIVFENLEDATDKQSKVYVVPADGSSIVEVMTFYATQDATYKIYSATEKLVLARLTRETAETVKVSGKVTAPKEMKGYSLAFTNTTTGVETVVTPNAKNKYSVSLNEKYTYKVSLKNADKYVISSAQELKLKSGDGDTTFDITAKSVELVTVSGKITGLKADVLSGLKVELTNAEKIYQPIVTIAPTEGEADYVGTYTAQFEKGVTYSLSYSGVNDYLLDMENTSLTYSEDATLDLPFVLKPVHKVTIAPTGASLSDLANATFTFTNLGLRKDCESDKGYTYKFVGTDAIALRDGVYSVEVKNTGAYVQKLTSNLVVNGADVTKTIGFLSDITEWDFSDEAFINGGYTGGEGTYNGLHFTNAKNNKTYLLSSEGTVSVPVKGACRIAVSVCYQYSFYFENETEASVGVKTGSTSQIDTFTYDYKGEAGAVDITVLGTSYITKIELIEVSEYKETVTVGADKEYKTINAALAAIAKMDRPNGERVTVMIDPGNYEEMLRVTVDNVTLKNASATPSIELTNKGVDIDENAVRITHYYGHGYTYYSMASDCTYNEEILAVNKENDYASFTNPGSGSTAGSYWNATVSINANGFEAEGIIFENSFNQYVSEKAADDVIVPQSSAKEGDVPRAEMKAGDTTVQNKAYVERAAALAIYDNKTNIYFENCKFVGRQDTLYGGKGAKAAFYDCSVYGGTDYIFGGMTAVFAKCDLVFNTSEDKNDVGYITAPQQASGRGYLMYNCNVTSTTPGKDTASEYTSKPGYFGRPWATNTSEAYFYKTVIDAADSSWYETYGPSLIRPEGWLATLSGESALCSEYGTFEYSKYAEYIDERASWAGYEFSEILADGTPVSVEAFLGDWDAFAGKDMTVVVPSESDRVDNKPVEEPAAGNFGTFVLESSKLEAFDKAAKKDGDTTVGGTNDFFTMIWSASSTVGSSSKTWDDGYSSAQRISLGGKASTSKNAIKFTTDGAATVNIWWVEGGDDKRQMTILDSTGNAVTTTAVENPVKNSPYMSTLELSAAGTYYLGGDINNNYIFKVEVTVSEPPKVSTLESSALEAFDKAAKKDGDTTIGGTDDFFTMIWSASSTVGSSSKTWDDGYSSAQRISLGGKASTTKNAIKFTTTRPASVEIWWVEGGDDKRQMTILDSTGNAVATTAVENPVKNSPYRSTLELGAAGIYYLGGDINNNYIFKVVVTEGEVAEVERSDWAAVEAPTVTAALSEDGKEINVTAIGLVGVDGADRIEVTMYDKDGKAVGEVQKSNKKADDAADPTSEAARTYEFTFAPEDSGDYTFGAALVRTGEDPKESAKTAPVSYKLPLGKPSISSISNIGGGKITIEWSEVKEATSYIVKVKDTDLVFETKETSYTITEGLEVGKAYTITVNAKRVVGEGEAAVADEGEAAETKITAREAKDLKWNFLAFGSGTDTKNNGFEGNANEGSVTVYSEGGKGKIVPASTDGLAFYYTAVPTTENFKLTAKVHVDKWTLSNGQEGFGLMAADRVPEKSSADTFWNNSYMASATKVEYYWDPETSSVANAGDKITMKIGLGSQEKAGVTTDNLALFDKNDTNTINNVFKTSMYPLSTSAAKNGAGTYNMIGNFTSDPGGSVDKPITDFTLSIERTDTSFIVSYINEYGREFAKKYYNTEDNLSALDDKNIYVGFFASRNARATYSDIKLETSEHNPDAEPEVQPASYINLSNSFISAPVSNKAEYTLQFNSNWKGTVMITDAAGNVIVPEAGAAPTNSKETTFGVSVPVNLAIGKNEFIAYFEPDATYTQDNGTTLLSDYSKKTTKFTVSYAKYGQDGAYLYVSPEGSAKGTGEKANPLDIYTAVKYVRPGQTILIMEGTYNLSKTIKVERGIDGTEDAMIKMIADPAASTRPVFDFGGNCAGMVLAGNYWYFRGFDVTRSQNAQKGIQVSGNNNVLDQINTYKNGNTGIQISRLNSTDETMESWPANNLILNCTSYLNADAGYEDADGFAAKLTVGEGNVFDGCVAHHNADDGWDLFAKVETGPIGTVEVRNSIAYKNGYVFDANGKEIEAGNGNGFKLGGESISGEHILRNSLAFDNKAKGIDSNSCPDIKVYNSIGFNNLSYNIAFYTNNASDTAFYAENTISLRYRNVAYDVEDEFDLRGSQVEKDVYNSTNYYWNVEKAKSVNADGDVVLARYFKSTTFNGFERNEDGTLNLNGFLELRDDVVIDGVEDIGLGDGQASEEAVSAGDVVETDGTIDSGNAESKDESAVDPDDIGGDVVVKDGLWVGKIDTQYYTGKAIKPAIAVYDGTKKLTKKDYSVSYKNNVKAGEATITVTGKGSYTGKATATFTIEPISFDEGFSIPTDNIYAPVVDAIQISDLSAEYNGKVQTPKPVVYFNGKKLSSKNYTVSVAGECKAAGTYTVTVSGKAPNFVGSRTIDFVIVDKENITHIKKAKVSGLKAVAVGEVPEITLKYKNATLVAGTDYEIAEVRNNWKAGKATMVIKGLGKFGGLVEKTFTVKATGLTTKNTVVTGIADSVVYDGKAVTFPGLQVTLKDGTVLEKDYDYTVTYKNNAKAGTASVVIKGIGAYNKTITKKFKITAYNISEKDNPGNAVLQSIPASITAKYVKGGTKIKLNLTMNGRTLVEGKDYTLSYKNISKVADASASKAPTVTIKGKNGFKGTITKKFTIVAGDFNALDSKAYVTASDVVYKNKKGNFASSKIVAYDGTKKLAKKTDYDKTIAYYAVIDGVEKQLDTKKDIVPAGTEVRVVITGAKNYTGTLETTYRVVKTDIKKATVKKISLVYNGGTVTLNVTPDEETGEYDLKDKIYYKGKALEYGVDYEIVPGTYKNNNKAGTAKVTIRGLGEYGGEKVITFKLTKRTLKWDE